ncbi:hypothetical protein SMC26_35130 [Actinomadura fulvescens]|uniref:MFS transporter n=1 Tax=Actinomadura fulvescens TaxID=46160 RepID=A0ABN3QYA2_9ACTN
MGTLATSAVVSVLAGCAAVVQSRTGRALDAGHITARRGILIGLALTATGLAAAIPGLPGVLTAAGLIGTGTGPITSLGFAALAATTPASHFGQTLGAAKVGRELGDAGGPLLVTAVATAATLTYGYAVLALLLAALALVFIAMRGG